MTDVIIDSTPTVGIVVIQEVLSKVL